MGCYMILLIIDFFLMFGGLLSKIKQQYTVENI